MALSFPTLYCIVYFFQFEKPIQTLNFYSMFTSHYFYLLWTILPRECELINFLKSIQKLLLFLDRSFIIYSVSFVSNSSIICFDCSAMLSRFGSIAKQGVSSVRSVAVCGINSSLLSRCANRSMYQVMRCFASSYPEHVLVSMPALSPVICDRNRWFPDNDSRRNLVVECEGRWCYTAWRCSCSGVHAFMLLL